MLSTIDLHHGFYSAKPPYSELEVIGASISEQITAALREYGFDTFSLTEGGFLVTRKIPAAET